MNAIATVGFIGTGNMGSAMIKGLSTRDDVALVGTDLNRDNLEALAPYRLEALGSAMEVAQRADYVILAIKPQDAEKICKGIAMALEGKCLVSICAGIRRETLSEWVGGSCPVIRVMPNTPAMVGEGVFAVCLEDRDLSETQQAFAAELFTDVGDVHILPEKLFDAFTAVAGSGPAYVFYFMEAIIEGGVTLGLTRPQATRIVEKLFTGSAKLATESDFHLSQLREMVTSPGGTTIEATNVMADRAVRGAIIEAIKACCKRSRELG